MMENYIRISSLFYGKNIHFSPINLNQFYLANKEKIPNIKTPIYLDNLVKLFPNYTIGGYAENRKDIWNNTYLDEFQNYIHLGVDINVPNGTMIHSPINAKVIDVFTDIDERIGWGGRVILQSNSSRPYIIFAHLNPNTINVKTGDTIERHAYLGNVGTWPSNGNTFEHLHLQLRLTDDFATMDGYGYEKDLSNNPCPFTTEI